jgi:hypothetical protein
MKQTSPKPTRPGLPARLADPGRVHVGAGVGMVPRRLG